MQQNLANDIYEAQREIERNKTEIKEASMMIRSELDVNTSVQSNSRYSKYAHDIDVSHLDDKDEEYDFKEYKEKEEKGETKGGKKRKRRQVKKENVGSLNKTSITTKAEEKHKQSYEDCKHAFDKTNNIAMETVQTHTNAAESINNNWAIQASSTFLGTKGLEVDTTNLFGDNNDCNRTLARSDYDGMWLDFFVINISN
jgi:hypothetical protein